MTAVNVNNSWVPDSARRRPRPWPREGQMDFNRRAQRACVRQAWFADDVNTQASSAQGIQLSVDGAYIGAFVTGNVMGVAGKNDPSKTG